MMKQWTYLSLKTVFQYMDVNKRLRVNFHCPALRPIERSVTMNLQSLSLEKDRIVVNDVCHSIRSRSPEAPEDPRDRIKSMLEGRKCIRVEHLKILDSSCIPEDLKVLTETLDSADLNLTQVLHHIKNSSIPLKELRVNISKTPALIFYSEMTKKLVISGKLENEEESERFRNVLFNFRNQYIVLEDLKLRAQTIATLVQIWQNNQREIGTVLTMNQEYEIHFNSVFIREVLATLDSMYHYLTHYDWSSIFHRFCISFPMNPRSEVVFYTVRDENRGGRNTVLEVKPIGSTRLMTFGDCIVQSLIVSSIITGSMWMGLIVGRIFEKYN